MRKYAIVSPTSLGIRITPTRFFPVFGSNEFFLQATSAESNTLSVPASLGLRVKALARFEEGDPVSELIRRDMHSRGIECEGPSVPNGGPWGERHPLNIAEQGFGLRGPRVCNDRSGELGRALSAEEFDLRRLFERDGAEILHLSGLVCSLSEETARFCLGLVKLAKDCGTKVSFDTNYRPSLWKGKEETLLCVFDEIASRSDILFGGDVLLEKREHAAPFFGRTFASEEDRIEGTEFLLRRTHEGYPDAEVLVSTMREVLSVNRHSFGAAACERGKITLLPPREMPVLDRIGGGDAFVGGFLYGTVKGWSMEEKLSFGCGCAAFVSGLQDDYGLPVSEEEIRNMQAEDVWTSR